MERLTIKIESNGVKHQLVLIKPWPPIRIDYKQLDKLRRLSREDIEIESVCPVFRYPPSPSDKPGIQIAVKNEDWITIHCDSIEYSI